MKNASEYARKIKRLLGTLKRGAGKTSPEASEDPLEQLMRGILGRTASESRVQTALSRLRTAMVDVNELRVTPVSELVEVIGADFPHARSVAESLSRALQAIYNRRHKLDLSFLKGGGRKGAETFLSNLDGVDAHARAVFLMGQFEAAVIPVDDAMLAFLRRGDYVPETAGREEVQAFLERYLPSRDAEAFYVLLKRHAAAHAPRSAAATRVSDRKKPGEGESVPAPVAAVAAGDGRAESKPAAKVVRKSDRPAAPSAERRKKSVSRK